MVREKEERGELEETLRVDAASWSFKLEIWMIAPLTPNSPFSTTSVLVLG